MKPHTAVYLGYLLGVAVAWSALIASQFLVTLLLTIIATALLLLLVNSIRT